MGREGGREAPSFPHSVTFQLRALLVCLCLECLPQAHPGSNMTLSAAQQMGSLPPPPRMTQAGLSCFQSEATGQQSLPTRSLSLDKREQIDIQLSFSRSQIRRLQRGKEGNLIKLMRMVLINCSPLILYCSNSSWRHQKSSLCLPTPATGRSEAVPLLASGSCTREESCAGGGAGAATTTTQCCGWT